MLFNRSIRLTLLTLGLGSASFGIAYGADLESLGAHDLSGTVQGLSANILTIRLDRDDARGSARKGDTIRVTITPRTRVRNGDRYLPGTPIVVAGVREGTTWSAVSVAERITAKVQETSRPGAASGESPEFTLMGKHQWARAIQVIQADLAHGAPGDSYNRQVDFLNLGECYYQQNDFARSARAYQTAVDLLPAAKRADRRATDLVPVNYVHLATAYFQIQNYSRASSYASQALAAGGPAFTADYAQAHLVRGIASVRTGRYANAIPDLSEAIRLEPKRWSGYSERGMALRETGNAAGSLNDFSSALRLEPSKTWLVCESALSLIDLGRDADAQRTASECLKRDPSLRDEYIPKLRLELARRRH